MPRSGPMSLRMILIVDSLPEVFFRIRVVGDDFVRSFFCKFV